MAINTPNPNQLASGKNFPLSPAASDLGLGDQLKQQLEDELAQRRKGTTPVVSPAVLALFGRTPGT